MKVKLLTILMLGNKIHDEGEFVEVTDQTADELIKGELAADPEQEKQKKALVDAEKKAKAAAEKEAKKLAELEAKKADEDAQKQTVVDQQNTANQSADENADKKDQTAK